MSSDTTEQAMESEVVSTNKVLVLAETMDLANNSREMLAAKAYRPTWTFEAITPLEWKTKTAEQFMVYRAILVAEPTTCVPNTAVFQALAETKETWGAVMDGRVSIMANNPVSNSTPTVVQNAIRFVMDTAQRFTGMYIALGCGFQDAPADTVVEILQPFGPFKVQGVPGCGASGHFFSTSSTTLNTSISDSTLNGSGACVAKSVFTSYPDHTFSFVTVAVASATKPVPGTQTYFDYLKSNPPTQYVGTPYWVVRGASPRAAGCGLVSTPPYETCDLGDGINGTPVSNPGTVTCSWSCHLDWCGDGVVNPEYGEECDLGSNNGRTNDVAGNLSTCNGLCQIVNLAPPLDLPPVAQCKNVTVEATNTCGVAASINNGSFDPDGQPLTCVQNPPSPYDLGTGTSSSTLVTLTCTDSAGNSASCTGTVTVLDKVAPVVTLNGPTSQWLECAPGTSYTDPGAIADDLCSGALPSSSISRTGSVNLGDLNTYTLTYVATDPANNVSPPETRTVTVSDTLPPILTVYGELETTVECGTTYVDPSATASDACAGPVAVTSTQTGDPYQPGIITISYSAQDPSGNTITSHVARTVHVIDNEPPTLGLVGPATELVECGTPYVDPGATANDACFGDLTAFITRSGSVNSGTTGSYPLFYNVTDLAGQSATPVQRTVEVIDTLPPQIQALPGPSFLECNGTPYVDPGATASDRCAGDLTENITSTSNLDQTQPGQYTVTYSVADAAGNMSTATRELTVGPCSSNCVNVHLSDYNLFLLGDYNGGHDVMGKVAAGGNITMTDFAVGAGLPDTNISNTLVAGGNLTLSRGGVWGHAFHGGSYSADTSVVYPRGTVAQGTPIDFAARFAELRSLSSTLASKPVNGTTVREVWGGVMMSGTDPVLNVFDVNASAFNGAVLWSIDAPAGSLVVVNIHGASASFGGFGISFSGGINQHGVLYNFVDTTSITAQGFGFWGTVLAPFADVQFSNGSWDGGLYAKSLTGNAEGHINPLHDRDICQ